LEASQLESEIQHLRESMTNYGLPCFGDIMPGLTLDDTRATFHFITAARNKRKKDIDFKTNIRNTIDQQGNKIKILEMENEKLTEKNDYLHKNIKTLTNQQKQNQTDWKREKENYTGENENLKKANLKLKHQVAQYKHELKKSEQQNEKLKEQIKKKIFDKGIVKNMIDYEGNHILYSLLKIIY
jgi:chromosome segregation ATPase